MGWGGGGVGVGGGGCVWGCGGVSVSMVVCYSKSVKRIRYGWFIEVDFMKPSKILNIRVHAWIKF